MALLESQFQFVGPLGNVSAYRMRGVDKIVVRKKGGATKKRIQNDREFERTRQINKEFGGRSLAVKYVAWTFYDLKPVADYNFYGHLNARIKGMQERDKDHFPGEREISFTKWGSLLDGFSLNRYTPLEQIIRTPITGSISRETRSGTVNIPQLVPGASFIPPRNCSFFQMIVTLGDAPDLFSKEKEYEPAHEDWQRRRAALITTPWVHVKTGAPATTLEIKNTSVPADDNYALVLSVGIAFGVPLPDGQVEQVKRVGAGKILMVR